MKKIHVLISSMLYLLSGIQAQHFSFAGNDPFGIENNVPGSSNITQRIMFFDYDGDEDLDLFLAGMSSDIDFNTITWETMPYFLDFQENIGDKSHPQFASRQAAFNGNFSFPAGFFFPSAGDLNGDGKIDFIINGVVSEIGNRTPLFYRNLNHAGSFDFERIPFSDLDLPDLLPESFFVPELTDLDHDGDLDILMSGMNPAFMEEDGPDVATFYYAKNIGTSEEPEFSGWFTNPYGLIPHPLVEISTSGDIDKDGDTDILSALSGIPDDSINYLLFHENIPGPDGKPSFSTATNSPFGLPTGFGEDQFFDPVLVDMDGDGDLDLFILQGTTLANQLRYFENNLCASVTFEADVNLCQGDSLVFSGTTYFEGGEFTITLQTSEGCDSVIFLNITTIPAYSVDLTETICEGETFTIGSEVFDATGSYTVLLTTTNGCDSLVSLSLTVNENETTSLVESICEGESYQVGNDVFDQSGHYTIHLSNQLGCDSLISLDLDVIHLDNTVIVADASLIANQFADAYQWFDCATGLDIPGETNQTFIATISGNYGVTVSFGGCSVESECQPVIINSSHDPALDRSVNLYPNPSNGVLFIENLSGFRLSTISVNDVYGKQIFNGNADQKCMDLSTLLPGVYFVTIELNGITVVKKIVKD